MILANGKQNTIYFLILHIMNTVTPMEEIVKPQTFRLSYILDLAG
jgi:hypothetical protein